jgi:hypothetical protein
MQGIVRRLRRLFDVIATFGAANATFGAAKFPVSYLSFVSETPKTTNWARTQKRNSFVDTFVSSFVSGGVSYPVSCDELLSLPVRKK